MKVEVGLGVVGDRKEAVRWLPAMHSMHLTCPRAASS